MRAILSSFALALAALGHVVFARHAPSTHLHARHDVYKSDLSVRDAEPNPFDDDDDLFAREALDDHDVDFKLLARDAEPKVDLDDILFGVLARRGRSGERKKDSALKDYRQERVSSRVRNEVMNAEMARGKSNTHNLDKDEMEKIYGKKERKKYKPTLKPISE